MVEAKRFTWPGKDGPSEAMRAAYEEDGYLLLEDFASADQCQALIKRNAEIVAAFQPQDHLTIFSTEGTDHLGDSYFEESGDKIRCFFEADAFDDQGQLRQDKTLSINKIGHALHDLDPLYESFSRQPAVEVLVKSLGMARPLLLQSMVIFKQPRIGGAVDCHQDSTFLHTDPLSCLGLWVALEDATLENGCLQAYRGQHKGPLRKRHYRNEAGHLVTDCLVEGGWPEDDRVVLEAPAGSLVVLHGSLPHMSGPNHSGRSRQAYSLHCIDGACHYGPENWLQRGEDLPLRGFAA